MATENKQLTAYVSREIEERLIEYCQTNEITRKDKNGNLKPALGTAVSEILEFFFTGKSEKGSGKDNPIGTKSEVLAMIRKEIERWSRKPPNSSRINRDELLDLLYHSSQERYPDDPKPNILLTKEELESWQNADTIQLKSEIDPYTTEIIELRKEPRPSADRVEATPTEIDRM